MLKKELKEKFIMSLSAVIDIPLSQKGFTRSPKSLSYKRTSDHGIVQRIEMYIHSNPAYGGGAIAHVDPYFSVYYPEVNEKVKELLGGSVLTRFSNINKDTFRQPIQMTYQSPLWLLYASSDMISLTEKILLFINEKTVPFLDQLISIDGFLSIFETKDSRLPREDSRYFVATGCYLVKGQTMMAKKVFSERFKGELSLKLYKESFNYLEKLSAQ